MLTLVSHTFTLNDIPYTLRSGDSVTTTDDTFEREGRVGDIYIDDEGVVRFTFDDYDGAPDAGSLAHVYTPDIDVLSINGIELPL